MPKPQTDTGQMMDVNELVLSKLQIGQSDPKEELVDMTNSLTTKALEEMAEKNDSNELSEAAKEHQQTEEKYGVYQRTYIGQLSEVEESDTESDYLGYSYFG